MPIETIWSVTHACEHSEDRDLSSKRADERARYARWLASKDCTNCWRARQADGGEGLSKEQWVAARRAEEAEAIAGWEQRAEMRPLDGSEKAIGWARRVRHTVLSDAYDVQVAEAGLSEEQWVAAIEAPGETLLYS